MNGNEKFSGFLPSSGRTGRELPASDIETILNQVYAK